MSRPSPRRSLPLLLLLLLLAGCAGTPAPPAPAVYPRNDSGGRLAPEQAAYDVAFYDIALELDPAAKSIEGVVEMRAEAVAPMDAVVLDLDPRLHVRDALVDGERAPWKRDGGRLRLELARPLEPGARFVTRVAYGGVPREAPRPPWEGGFTWSRTADGSPWIATSNQGEGADLWWPCKDHPSDEPNALALHVRVPEPLVVAANGRLANVEEHGDATRTWHWFVSTPINNYTVALNVAPYVLLERAYVSTSGDVVPVKFWVLPENRNKGANFLDEIVRHLAFMERHFGPYPFRADKYGVVETPHLGMEHQTIIAYGNDYRPDPKWHYDWLHHHELAHEWWANMVTAPDWNDFWLHEGIATYAQNLWIEETHGADAYLESMRDHLPRILNRRAVAPREPRSSGEMYFLDLDAPDGERVSDSDIYFKGAWVLHTLRWLIGDEDMTTLLRRFAYPDPALEAARDGSQCRFATTDDFTDMAEQVSGRELEWFEEVYLRQPALPRLEVQRNGGTLALRWDVPDDLPFPMPVPLRIEGERRRVEMPGGHATLELPPNAKVEVDPDGRVLRAGLLPAANLR